MQHAAACAVLLTTTPPRPVWCPALFVVAAAQNADRFDSEIIYDRDFDYDYFGFKVCRPVGSSLHGC